MRAVTQPPSAHPQYQQQHPGMRAPAPPPPRRRQSTGAKPLLGALTALLAAGLAAAGLFWPLYTVRDIDDQTGEQAGYDANWWGLENVGDDDAIQFVQEISTLAGLALAAAAALLVPAALFVFLAGRSVRPGVRTAGRSLVSAGTGLLLGVVALGVVDGFADIDVWQTFPVEPGRSRDIFFDLGLFLPLGGLVLAILAVVFAHLGGRRARREPATPPMGFRRPQYGPGPMTGPQPAVPGPGQSSGRFAPVPPPGTDPGAGQFAPGGTQAPTPPPATGPAGGQAPPQAQAPVSQTPVSQPPVSQPPVSPPAAPDESPLASRLDGTANTSTSDSPGEQDPDITQRTTVHAEPQPAPSGGESPAPTPPPAAPARAGEPGHAAASSTPEPGPPDLPAAPPAPEPADGENKKAE